VSPLQPSTGLEERRELAPQRGQEQTPNQKRILKATERSFLHVYTDAFGGQGRGLEAVASLPNVESRLPIANSR